MTSFTHYGGRSVPTLVRKWKKNEKAKAKRANDMANLNLSITPEDIAVWTAEIDIALRQRVADPKAMDKFLVSMKQCKLSLIT